MPEAEEATKVKLFYNPIGETGRELCVTLMSDVTAARRMVKKMIEKFDRHCNPKVNETVERYCFFMRNQGQEENIETYVTDLRMLSGTCNFGQIRDSLIRENCMWH